MSFQNGRRMMPVDKGTLRGVVEDDAEGMAQAATQAAHAMPHIDTVDAARAVHWAVKDREDHAVALPQRHHFGA